MSEVLGVWGRWGGGLVRGAGGVRRGDWRGLSSRKVEWQVWDGCGWVWGWDGVRIVCERGGVCLYVRVCVGR